MGANGTTWWLMSASYHRPGNDVIRVVGKHSNADVQLGPGRDTFIGGPNND